jgi:hypothetical protein
MASKRAAPMIETSATEILIEIMGSRPPTLNELMRRTVRARIALQVAWNVAVAFAYRGHAPAVRKRRVDIVILNGPGQRGADPDAYQKSTGDALVACRALVDDSRFWVEWRPVAYKSWPREGVRILLTDIDEPNSYAAAAARIRGRKWRNP